MTNEAILLFQGRKDSLKRWYWDSELNLLRKQDKKLFERKEFQEDGIVSAKTLRQKHSWPGTARRPMTLECSLHREVRGGREAGMALGHSGSCRLLWAF
jgi:hypothetical protein